MSQDFVAFLVQVAAFYFSLCYLQNYWTLKLPYGSSQRSSVSASVIEEDHPTLEVVDHQSSHSVSSSLSSNSEVPDDHPMFEAVDQSSGSVASSWSLSSTSELATTVPSNYNDVSVGAEDQQQRHLPQPSFELGPWVPLTGKYLKMYERHQRAAEQRQQEYSLSTTHLGRAWKFVRALQSLVQDFNCTYQRNKSAVVAPVIGNFTSGPHYKSILRRFYLKYDPQKLVVLDDILEQYKVRT
jgi:hypothetical protein